MAKIKKINKEQLSQKICSNCFAPVYIKFNLSYITYDEDFDDTYQLQFFKRMRNLSNETYLTVSQWPKNIGFEIEDKKKLGINLEIPQKFQERFPEIKYNNKFGIIRLYTNNKPIVGRIIGVFINKVFYVLFIDINGNLYNH